MIALPLTETIYVLHISERLTHERIRSTGTRRHGTRESNGPHGCDVGGFEMILGRELGRVLGLT